MQVLYLVVNGVDFVSKALLWLSLAIKGINVVHSPYSTVTLCSSVSTSLLVPAGHLFTLHMVVTAVDLTPSNDCGGVW